MNSSLKQDLAEDSRPIPTLISALASPSVFVLKKARCALVEHGSSAVPALVQALKDPNDQVRWEAARTLAEIHDPATAGALVDALRDDEPGVRWLASRALALMWEDGLTPLFHALVHQSDSVWLREGAHHVLHALNRGGLARIVAPVLTALDDREPALEVPIAATRALETLAESSREQEAVQ